MPLKFESIKVPESIARDEWFNWKWQFKHSLKTPEQFLSSFDLTANEQQFFAQNGESFKIQVTPYYAQIAKDSSPIRKILVPNVLEYREGRQQMLDPLAEKAHNPAPRIIHRYPDRVLFLVTDICSVYCRFCTRKHFTGQEQAFASESEYSEALNYIAKTRKIREVILSGGDPLTLSDERILKVLRDLRKIDHVEIIRIGTRMPVVAPMRITKELAAGLREYAPVFIMSHFNHPKELTAEAAEGLRTLVDHGIPVFNQMVLLNGVNNHPAIVQALARRLLYLRVKPYYMFQADPSMGTDHLRTSVEESMAIQRELWGRLSGLAMPNLCLDIPGGGGKVGLVPNFETSVGEGSRSYRGWDARNGDYINPDERLHEEPNDIDQYLPEWEEISRR